MERFRHHPLLGTVLEVVVDGVDADTAQEIDRAVVATIGRLESLLSVYDRTSALERWKRGELADPGLEVNRVLAEALEWQLRSSGAFNTATGAVTALWRAGAERDRVPTATERAEVAAAIARPTYRIEDGIARPVGDVSGISLNAFAKGWIVDRAMESAIDVASAAGATMSGVTISAGGDLRHRGSEPIVVGIENPLRPYDNEPPIAHVELGDGGLATSGRSRRGVRIGGRWHAHVVDPRTAATVDDVASVSVLADDAATADVIATIVGLESPERIPALADDWGVAALAIGPDGRHHTNAAWDRASR